MGKKKAAAKAALNTQKEARSSAKGKEAKTSAVGISHEHASRIRDILQDLDAVTLANDGREATARQLSEVYDHLLGHGFQQEDVQDAIKALRSTSEEAALDWLCLHVPPERLPKQFSAGAHTHERAARARVIVAAPRVKSDAELAHEASERAIADAAWEAERAAAQAAQAARAAEDAARAAGANKAAILSRYAAAAGEESDDGGGGHPVAEEQVEEWEIWGDPREVERRRAERSRAAQLNMLTPEQRKRQLADELQAAMEHARAAKVSGSKEQKRVAGEVIKQLKQEMVACGIKEAEVRALVDARRPPAPPQPENNRAMEAAGSVTSHSQAHAAGDRGSGCADARGTPANLVSRAKLATKGAGKSSGACDNGIAACGEQTVGTADGGGLMETWEAAGDVPGTRGAVGAESPADTQQRASAAGGGRAKGKGTGAAAHPQPNPPEEQGAEFDANTLWDDEGALEAVETAAAPSGKADGALPGVTAQGAEAIRGVPVRVTPKRAKPVAQPQLPVAAPKAVLQQMCHKHQPPWPAPRFTKLSRAGEPLRYACTIIFPRARRRRKGGGGEEDGPPEGPRTWQLPESEDGWGDIQLAQHAAALRALLELTPGLAETYQLEAPYAGLWERWTQGGGSTVAAAAEARRKEREAFLTTLLQQDAAEHAARPASAGGAQPGADGEAPAERDALRYGGHELTPAEAAREGERMQREQIEWRGSPAGREWAAKRGALPVSQIRGPLADALRAGDYAVLSGDTGCGKTTQVPQFILEDEVEAGRGAAVQIVCTQPRRIAATSVAERVAAERGEPPPGRRGSRVGYHVRLDPAVSPDTRLTFVTTGILLRRLAGDPSLRGVTHVVVDEVHERSLQGDFLLALLRRLVATRAAAAGPGGAGAARLKVVLMSATIDLQMLSEYVGWCPRLTAEGRTFPVKQFFLEDVYAMTGYHLEADSAAAVRARRDRSFQKQAQKQAGKQAALVRSGWGDDDALQRDAANRHYDATDFPGYSAAVHTNLARADEAAVDFDLLEDLVRHLDAQRPPGAILVFLPGMAEITQLCDRLNGSHQFKGGAHWVIPLHSTVAPEDQRRAFAVPPDGTRKIVVATNIAETSVTIEDVAYVVDCGKLKERRFSAARGLSMLVLDHVSQASALQRKGRAGRVREGECYSLFTRPAFERRMPRFQVPEVARVPLDELVLQILFLALGRPSDFLAELLQPPPAKAVAAALASLREIGAIGAPAPAASADRGWQDAGVRGPAGVVEGEAEAEAAAVAAHADGVLTPLGAHLAQLPVEPRLGKLLVTAAFMGCLSDALTIAASLSYKTPFSTAFAAAEAAEAARRHLASEQSACVASGAQSDHLVVLAAFAGWRAAHDRGGTRLARDYVQRHCLSFATLQMLADMRGQFAGMLADIGLISPPPGVGRQRAGVWVDDAASPWNAHSGRAAIVKAALCAALYPQVASMDSDATLSKRPTWTDRGVPVALHPSSVLHPLLAGHFRSPYVAFSEKMQTSSTFLRDATVVSPLALLLFGGELEVHHEAGYVLLDGALKIKVAAQTAVLVKRLRLAWAAMMDDKVKRPQGALTASQQKVLDTIASLLTDEGS